MYTGSTELVGVEKEVWVIEKLIEIYAHRIYRYCFSILRDAHEAEDATQDVFMKAMQYKNLKDIEHISAWLYKIAYRHCINKYRRKSLIPFIPHTEKHDISVEQEGRDEELQYILSQLMPKERALIVLRIVEDKDFTEIASILGTTVPTARKRFERVKGKIQKIIEGNGEYAEQNEKL